MPREGELGRREFSWAWRDPVAEPILITPTGSAHRIIDALLSGFDITSTFDDQ
jgi:hypothetical protein